jgi:hypothetical protein
MISRRFWQNFGPSGRVFGRIPLRQIFRISLLTLVFVSLTGAQDQGSSAPAQQTEPPAPAGGPQSDVGPYAIPSKKKDEPPPPPPPEKPKKIEGMPDYSIHVDASVVEVPVMAVYFEPDERELPYF